MYLITVKPVCTVLLLGNRFSFTSIFITTFSVMSYVCFTLMLDDHLPFTLNFQILSGRK